MGFFIDKIKHLIDAFAQDAFRVTWKKRCFDEFPIFLFKWISIRRSEDHWIDFYCRINAQTDCTTWLCHFHMQMHAWRLTNDHTQTTLAFWETIMSYSFAAWHPGLEKHERECWFDLRIIFVYFKWLLSFQRKRQFRSIICILATEKGCPTIIRNAINFKLSIRIIKSANWGLFNKPLQKF